MYDVRTFLGSVVLAAAVLGILVSAVLAPVAAQFTSPNAVHELTSWFQVLGSLGAGVAALVYVHRARK